MGTTSATRQEKLRALTVRFIREAPEIMARIVKGCARRVGGPVDLAGYAESLRQAHMLAGTAGAFGWTAVSGRARDLEILLESTLEAGRLPQAGLLSHRISELGRVLSDAMTNEDREGIS